jgi:DNA polymerase-4
VRRILHCDMDCFYAAVHMRDEPALAGKPVVIGGSPEGRGVVAAASYEARRFDVRSAIPAARARRLCPDAVFLSPDFPRYRKESEAIFEIFRRYTPLVQAVSIDEAYLDVSDHLGERGSATAVAREIKERVRAERRLTVSIGVGPSRLVAKIASDFDKPDGLTVVPPRRVLDFLAPLPVRSLPGVGPATERVLKEELGIATIAELRAQPAERLASRFGRHGDGLYRYARGIDERPVVTSRERKSLGTETTYPTDLEGLELMDGEVGRLAAEVAAGLAKRRLAARTVTVKVRYRDFTTVTRAHTLPWPVDAAAEIAVQARRLLRLTDAARRPVRLLGVTASSLVRAGEGQLPLFD